MQITIRKEHEQLIRFIWIDEPGKEESRIIEYRWKRIPFRLSCSPFILKAAILKHMKEYEDEYPKTVTLLQQQLYVDDWLGGESSGEEVKDIIRQADMIQCRKDGAV